MVKYGLALVYASSAATYGDGTFGYSDSHAVVGDLKPPILTENLRMTLTSGL